MYHESLDRSIGDAVARRRKRSSRLMQLAIEQGLVDEEIVGAEETELENVELAVTEEAEASLEVENVSAAVVEDTETESVEESVESEAFEHEDECVEAAPEVLTEPELGEAIELPRDELVEPVGETVEVESELPNESPEELTKTIVEEELTENIEESPGEPIVEEEIPKLAEENFEDRDEEVVEEETLEAKFEKPEEVEDSQEPEPGSDFDEEKVAAAVPDEEIEEMVERPDIVSGEREISEMMDSVDSEPAAVGEPVEEQSTLSSAAAKVAVDSINEAIEEDHRDDLERTVENLEPVVDVESLPKSQPSRVLKKTTNASNTGDSRGVETKNNSQKQASRANRASTRNKRVSLLDSYFKGL